MESDVNAEAFTLQVESDTFMIVSESFRQGLVSFFESEASRSQKGMKPEQLWFEHGVGLGNKEDLVVQLYETAPTAVVRVNEEYFVADEGLESGNELGFAAKKL